MKKQSKKLYKVSANILYLLGGLCLLIGLISIAVGGVIFILLGLVCIALGKFYSKKLNTPILENNNTDKPFISDMVYINKNSKVYHINPYCGFIKGSYSIVDKNEVIKKGMKECKHCTR